MLAGARKARVAPRLNWISGASRADHRPWGDVGEFASGKKSRSCTHMSLALADTIVVGIACLRGLRGKLPCCQIAAMLLRGTEPGCQPGEATVAVKRVVIEVQ